MLQAAVLALGVFPDNEDIYVPVPGHYPRQALTVDDVGIEVQASAGGTERGAASQCRDALLAQPAPALPSPCPVPLALTEGYCCGIYEMAAGYGLFQYCLQDRNKTGGL